MPFDFGLHVCKCAYRQVLEPPRAANCTHLAMVCPQLRQRPKHVCQLNGAQLIQPVVERLDERLEERLVGDARRCQRPQQLHKLFTYGYVHRAGRVQGCTCVCRKSPCFVLVGTCCTLFHEDWRSLRMCSAKLGG